jgi:CRISPR system Cascade subunit CasC
MDRFVQIHMLTHYPPSNPNRDDLGRPKTAIVGGAQRQRISSQSLKHALRKSEVFANELAGKMGERTQRLGEDIVKHLKAKGAEDATATKIARDIAAIFGKLKAEKDKDPLQIEQLAFVSPDEKARALQLAEKVLNGAKMPTEAELKKEPLLMPADGAVDIAMFGRMLAASPEFNRDAAVQIAHALTTNKVDVEDDYYTAVDDLKTAETDAGAGFVGEAGYGSGVYYVYACVNCEQLVKNLANDEDLSKVALGALMRALPITAPGGKMNSFAQHAKSEFVLVERGNGQPLNLFSAFAKPVKGEGLMEESIKRLTTQREKFAKCYGASWSSDMTLDLHTENSATLDELVEFAKEAIS